MTTTHNVGWIADSLARTRRAKEEARMDWFDARDSRPQAPGENRAIAMVLAGVGLTDDDCADLLGRMS